VQRTDQHRMLPTAPASCAAPPDGAKPNPPL
jgi:hypothetical protein